MKRKVISILSIMVVLSCFFFVPKIEADTLEEQRRENQNKQEQAQKDLEYVQEELSEALVKIQELDDKIRAAESEIASMDTELSSLEIQVNETTQKLEIVQQSYEQNKALMEDRLVVMYECGDISYLDLLLQSSNLIEFLSNYYIIEEIMRSDNEILESIEQEKNEIEMAKQQLEEEKTKLKELKVKKEQTRIIMQNNKTVQQGQIDKLSDSEKELQQKLQEYKEEEARIEGLIRVASGDYEYSGDFTGGVMAWPIAKSGTYITSGYSIREHPIQGITKFHTGIDIGNAGFGAPVIAAADGVVSLASYYGGYGNCVMINHGNGISTLYGHGQKILTTVGTEVKKGDLIMEVGSTGMSTGPHLHFEVRINGSHVNPLPYVQGSN